ncbi:hypothetical protein HQO27_01780 [Rhodococcus fascians]|nr:hypothetical protein [Rhodococcus fascians]MBY4237826.1 hypothetical protein [Rhodococcus fascians]MBY4253423.1 hypothetical protein [Rhodococcus fascians]MBY4269060.1 hypothetical protein [Rhodococcus fascians]MBY4275113.1 hypothetical protein [Rhodococcus fascians]
MNDLDSQNLRHLLFSRLAAGGHKDIDARFADLGLTDTSQQGSSKAQRVQHVMDTLEPSAMKDVAAWALDHMDLTAAERNGLQDVLWRDVGPVIEERTRREAAAVVHVEDLLHDQTRFEALLDRWWVLGDAPIFNISNDDVISSFFGGAPPLRRQIHQHVFRNPGDWSWEMLLERLGAFEAVDRRFARFIEDVVSHAILPTEEHQQQVVTLINPALRQANLELREVDSVGGYPVFSLVSTQTPTSRPKTIIFASASKPDLRVSDAVAGEIEIVDARGALVYDAVIGTDGLRFDALCRWWSALNQEIEDSNTARSLYERLNSSIPAESPPQHHLFWAYHNLYRARLGAIPALLPEVWLHWDPKTIETRGVKALLGQRMDFLMLGPNNQRIILEVDGDSRYTDANGKPSPARYARNTRYDRDMQLRNYSVYRFGGYELPSREVATELLADFFERLFFKHHIDLA